MSALSGSSFGFSSSWPSPMRFWHWPCSGSGLKVGLWTSHSFCFPPPNQPKWTLCRGVGTKIPRYKIYKELWVLRLCRLCPPVEYPTHAATCLLHLRNPGLCAEPNLPVRALHPKTPLGHCLGLCRRGEDQTDLPPGEGAPPRFCLAGLV